MQFLRSGNHRNVHIVPQHNATIRLSITSESHPITMEPGLEHEIPPPLAGLLHFCSICGKPFDQGNPRTVRPSVVLIHLTRRQRHRMPGTKNTATARLRQSWDLGQEHATLVARTKPSVTFSFLVLDAPPSTCYAHMAQTVCLSPRHQTVTVAFQWLRNTLRW